MTTTTIPQPSTKPRATPGRIVIGIALIYAALAFYWLLKFSRTSPGELFSLDLLASTIAVLPVLILFFFLQRYLVEDLISGAVKR